jgi:hypothetical protein
MGHIAGVRVATCRCNSVLATEGVANEPEETYMRRAATAIGALAMVATLATACGSSSSDDATSEATATTEAPARSTTTTADPNAPTEAQLESALLTAAEMGTDWVVGSDSSDDSSGGCLTELLDDGTIPGPNVDVELSYTADNGVTAYVTEGLAYAGSDADSVFTAVSKALGSCDTSADAPDGMTSVEPISFPSYGEDSAAFSATLSDGDTTLTMYMVAALQDDVIVLVAAGQTAGTMETSAVEPVMKGAVAKVKQAASS